MRFLICGCNGMAGHTIALYLKEQGHDVFGFDIKKSEHCNGKVSLFLSFPYDENEVLNSIFFRSIRGHFIQMSATPSDKVLEFFKQDGYAIVSLNTRYHGHPLPVPYIINKKSIIRYYYLIKNLKRFSKHNKQVFVFAPTIDQCEEIYFIVKHFIKKVSYVHSKCKMRNWIIRQFKHGGIRVLITTAVLERGVTVKNLQVIIFNADHPLYDKAQLIQISGRVGRKRDAPTGEVIYISERTTKAMRESIRDIKTANRDL